MMQTSLPMTLIPALSARSLVFLGIAIFIVAMASVLGSTATTDAIPTWYVQIRKPWFTPPNLVFPIAWTLLFALMAFSFWRILRHVDAGDLRRQAILAFLVQILFNIGWSFTFFGARNPGAGVIVATGLVLAVATMVLTFRKLDTLAAWLQIPYLCWVSFALFLTIAIWRLN